MSKDLDWLKKVVPEKSGNILKELVPLNEDFDSDGVRNQGDCLMWDEKHQEADEKWIQEAVEDEGRVRQYLRRVYGDKAFKKNGNIKQTYLDRAIKRVEKGPGKNVDDLLSALRLAKRLKNMGEK